MFVLGKKIIKIVGYSLAGLLIFMALLVSISRFLTPTLTSHHVYFENLASQYLHKPVTIQNIRITWNIYEPQLTFDDVKILDETKHQSVFEIPRFELNIAIWESLFKRKLVLDDLKVVGVHLVLQQQSDHHIAISGFGSFDLQSHDNANNEVVGWLLTQPSLVLRDANVDYISLQGYKISAVVQRLALLNTTTQHTLRAQVILNQAKPTRVDMEYRWQGDITKLDKITGSLTLHVGYIDLADANAILQGSGLLPDTMQTVLAQLAPAGALINVTMTASGALNNFSNLALSGKFSQLHLNAWKDLPAIHRLQGDVNWNGVEGTITLNSSNLTVTLDKVFSKPITLDQLTGTLNLQKDSSGAWHVNTEQLLAKNNDAQADVKVNLTVPLNESPIIDLKANFTLANAAHVSRYLPLKIFHPKLAAWLNQAFLKGQATQGEAILQGRLNDFPFDDGKGKFYIRALASHVDFRFAHEWPIIHDISGQLVFSNREMTIDVTHGKIFDTELASVHAEIPHLGDAKPQILNVTGLVQADLMQGMQYIQASPLRKTLGKDLAALKLQGPMQLKLNLSVPLHNPDETKVIGDTNVLAAKLSLPEWNLSIDQLNGSFHFTEKGVTAENLRGQLFNQPILLTLSTPEEKGKARYVEANLQGSVSADALQKWLNLPANTIFSGSTQYQVELHLPSHESPAPTQIFIRSDLQGIQIALPPPLNKEKMVAQPLLVELNIRRAEPLLAKIRYDKLFTAALTLKKKLITNDLEFISGEVRIGDKMANVPIQPGLLITGDLQRLNWSDVQPLLAEYFAKNNTNKFNFNIDILRGVNVTVKQLNIFNQQLDNVDLDISFKAKTTQINLNNANIAGQIILPANFSEQPVQAHFQHFYMVPANKTDGFIDPKTLPPIAFVGDDVRIAGTSLGKVNFDMAPSGNGVVISHLTVTSSVSKLEAKGHWQLVNKRYESQLEGSLTTPNVGDLLAQWGFASKNIVGSQGTAQFDLSWAGPLFRPELAKLTGHLSLKLSKGRIINLGNSTDAQMGLGRMLNVFSLQTIPRRLSLDFSDLFEKGYSFDDMKGDFTFKDGNALTDNTRFDGPVARIDISGRIGLAQKDFDMKFDVTPYVTSSLPVVATLVGGLNPIAGVATWVVDKMVSHEVSKIVTHQYTVTGSWDNPVWQKINTTSGQ